MFHSSTSLIHSSSSSIGGVDLLTGLFDGSPGRSPFLLRVQFAAPFALTLADGAALSVLVTSRGDLTLNHPTGTHEVPESTLVLIRGDQPWSIADDPGSPVTAVVPPGQRCESPTGEPLAEQWSLGIRTWGNADEPSATHIMVAGAYETVPETGRSVLASLPDVLVVPDGAIDHGLVAMFAQEVVREDIAQPIVLSRTLDLLVVLAVRYWMRQHGSLPPGALRGLGDPVVGPAIRLLQSEPAERWTIQALARRVGVSRAALAKRFNEVVGTPPIAFLTDWRLSLAADRLATSRDPIARIADEVGYSSAFALSTAFKRRYGVSPHRYRTAQAA
jgi:AraC-like DNA-binding protein